MVSRGEAGADPELSVVGGGGASANHAGYWWGHQGSDILSMRRPTTLCAIFSLIWTFIYFL